MTTIVGEKVFCPFCSIPLPLWVDDRSTLVPVISKKGDFRVKCRSSTCKGRLIDIDIRSPVVIT